jgi:sugar lactone lactonase YvrE
MNHAKGHTIYAILVCALLIPASLACTVCGPMVNGPLTSSTEANSVEPEAFAVDLGSVYGLAFDEEGYLFAVGSKGDTSVLWRIDPNGEKELFAEILDRGDKLSDAGLAAHASFLASVAIDGERNVWITSRRQGACFVVTPDKDALKIYLNGYMSVTLQDTLEYSQGVAWDADSEQLHIITSGPESAYGTVFREHIRALTLDEINNITVNESKTMNNTGVEIQEKGNGLVQGRDALYLIGRQALYEVKADGELKKAGVNARGMTLWGGVADGEGAMYLAANDADYTPEEGLGKSGLILKMDSEGKQTVLLEGIGQPLGMAFRGGYLYVADRATGSILRIEIR